MQTSEAPSVKVLEGLTPNGTFSETKSFNLPNLKTKIIYEERKSVLRLLNDTVLDKNNFIFSILFLCVPMVIYAPSYFSG